MRADAERHNRLLIGGILLLLLLLQVLFGARLFVGFLSQYLVSPLQIKYKIALEDMALRTNVKRKAIERLTRAKTLLSKVQVSRVKSMQDTAPQSAQQDLTNKLSKMTVSQDEERRRILEMTRTPGLLGCIRAALGYFQKRKGAKDERDSTAAPIVPEWESGAPLEISQQEVQAREMEKALRPISFDISGAGRQCKLVDYSTFQEFNGAVIQFGYLAYFSAAFSAAPLLAWLYNINEVRLDAGKLVSYSMRPHLYRVKGVRVWVDALAFIAYTGMMINILI